MTVWKYLILDEAGGVTGTQDKDTAMEAAQYDIVIDVERGVAMYDDVESVIKDISTDKA